MTEQPGVPSPCVSICKMDAESGYCEGCWRTIEEIARWSQMGDAEKRAVWNELPARRQQKMTGKSVLR